MVVVSCFVCYYYNMVVGWALFYFMSSMSDPLPWATCNAVNRTLTEGEVGHGTFGEAIPSPVSECANAGSAEYYWYRETLDISADYYPISEGVNPKYVDLPITTPMTLVLCLAWLIVFYLLMNGAEATGGALYFIALMPYFVLAVFLGIGLSSVGGSDGLVRLFQPDWSALQDPQLWVKAASQIFFSLSVCYGGIISFASYNPVNHNFQRDSMIVALVNSGTSLLASCVIFALLGSRAFKRTENCIELFTERALDRYDLPSESYPNYDALINDLSRQYPADFTDENIVANFGSMKCDFEQILIGIVTTLSTYLQLFLRRFAIWHGFDFYRRRRNRPGYARLVYIVGPVLFYGHHTRPGLDDRLGGGCRDASLRFVTLKGHQCQKATGRRHLFDDIVWLGHRIDDARRLILARHSRQCDG